MENIQNYKDALASVSKKEMEQRKTIKRLLQEKEELKKQLALYGVGCSLPSKEELLSVYEKTIKEKHKGLDELEREWIKLGFMYYHRYLSEKNK